MATNKKPRKRYNPNKLCRTQNKPRLDSVYHIFAPIYTALDKIKSGEIEEINGRVMFKDFEGHWCDLAYAMLGWGSCWERIGKHENIEYDSEPLTRIAKKLDLGMLLEERDVEVFKEHIDYTKKIFMSLPVHVTKELAKTEQIAIECERLKLTAA